MTLVRRPDDSQGAPAAAPQGHLGGPLVRYRETGPLAALRGVVGRLTAHGARLRGQVRAVPLEDLERPRYWLQTDGAWSGPYDSWQAATRLLRDVLTLWGADVPDGLDVASPDGWEGYAAGCRLRIVPGGNRQPD